MVPGGGDAEASVLLVPSASTGPGNTVKCLLCHGALGPKSYSELTPFFTPSSRPGPGSQMHSAAPSPQGPSPSFVHLHSRLLSQPLHRDMARVGAGWNLDSHSRSSGSDSFPPGLPASLGWYVEHQWSWGSKAIRGLTLGFWIKIW